MVFQALFMVSGSAMKQKSLMQLNLITQPHKMMLVKQLVLK